MPRLTAARRLAIMSASLALAEDQDASAGGSITLGEIASRIGETVEDVRESLDPLYWVEIQTPEGIVDLLDAIDLDDERLTVERAWWRRLAVLSPAEAARLYIKAAAAASIDSAHSIHLATAMAKLRRMVGGVTVVESDPPKSVADLKAARDNGDAVIVNIEGNDRTIVTSGATFVVVAVYRSGSEWMVTLESTTDNRDLHMTTGDVTTLPVERVLGIIPAPRASSTTDNSPAVIDPEPRNEVTIEYPSEQEWVLDPLSPRDLLDVGEGKRRATVDVWGRSEMKTLMLRLGPDSEEVSPVDFVGARREAAREILRLYD